MKKTTLAIMFLAGAFPAWANPLLGETLPQAEKTSLFQHFKLEEKKSSKVQQFRFFIPAAKEFQSQFMVIVRLDIEEERKITQIEVELDRKLVDDSTTAAYAREIAKTFVQEALPLADRARYKDLIQAFEQSKPSQNPGYLVFLGKQESWKDTHGDYTVDFLNVGKKLELTVTQKSDY